MNAASATGEMDQEGVRGIVMEAGLYAKVRESKKTG